MLNLANIKSVFHWLIAKNIHVHLVFAILLTVRIYVALHHEIFRDDVQPFNVAAQAHSFGDLLQAARYERSHALWPVLMYILNSFGMHSVLGLQMTYVGFSVITLGIVIYGIPRIPFYVRVLLGSSFWLMFEYTALVRPYGVTVMLLAIFLMLEIRWPKQVALKTLTLVLLAFSNIYGLVMAGAFGAYVFWTVPAKRRVITRVSVGAILVVTAVLSLASAWPPPDIFEDSSLQAYRAGVFAGYGIPRALYASAHIVVDGFMYVPRILMQYGWWNQTSQVRDWIPLNSRLDHIIGVVGIFAAAGASWRMLKINFGIAAAGAILWLGCLGALMYGHWGDIWHLGQVVMATLVLLAILHIKYNSFSGKRYTAWILSVLLILSTVMGSLAVYADSQHVFSQATNMVNWLEKNAPGETPVIYPAAWGNAYTALTRRPYYVLEGEKLMYAMRSDISLLKPVSPLIVDKLELPPAGRIVVIGQFPLPVLYEKGKFRAELLASFSPSIEWTESLWIYRVYPASDNSDWDVELNPHPSAWANFDQIGLTRDGYTFISSSGNDLNLKLWDDPQINNRNGAIAETRLRILKGPTSGRDGMVLTIEDGRFLGKLSFFEHRVELFDGSRLGAVYWMDTTSSFHTYRISMKESKLKLYIDGNYISEITLTEPWSVYSGRIVLGDDSRETGQNIQAEIESLYYSRSDVTP